MKLSYKHIVLLGILVAGLVSCRQEDPEHAVSLELNLCLPAQEMVNHAPSRRIMGDPGANEVFALPKYAYIFVTKEDGGVKTLWQKKEMEMNPDNWEKTRYYGLYDTDGDYIYKYKERAVFLLSNATPKGKVYVICSNKKLMLTPTFASISTLDDVMNLKFNTAPDSIQENLQNIYSTPYNYTRNGEYYCTYDCSAGNVYTIDLLLYHVAAKVDLKWNVADNMRINKADPSAAVRLTYMESQHLYDGQAYCFKPLRNEAVAKISAGYSIENIVTAADEGLWWEGRSYFYTIPYVVTGAAVEGKVYFPLQMKMETNGSGSYYLPTLNLKIDTTAVFVPWLRANFNITAPLAAGTDTKTVDD